MATESKFAIRWDTDEMTAALFQGVKEEMWNAAQEIARHASRLAPRDRPWHYKQIKAFKGKAFKGGANLQTLSVNRWKILVGIRGSALTGFLEWGTRLQEKQPHMYPAYDTEKPRLLERLRGKFK